MPKFLRSVMTAASSACCNPAVRLLLIEEDVRRCAHIQQRLISWRPHAELVVHRPVTQGALAREVLERETFAHVLAAAERRQAHARAIWRTSYAGRETQRFGDAFIRGYRCI